jgi:acetylornithine deacetylase/succinyl-diaminopimelate desuccinylase-like protein
MPFWDEKPFLNLLRHLMATPGATGQEEARRRVLEAFFLRSGIPFGVDAAGNLEVIFPQATSRDAVILDAHMDVVGPGCGALIVEKERLRGPGVADNLAAVTFLALLAQKLHAHPLCLKRPLHLLFSVCEEGEGNLLGIRHFISRIPRPPHAFLCLDLGMENFSLCGTGSLRYRVRVEGPGGHSWEDWGRENAISALIRFLLKAEALADTREVSREDRLTCNIGSIEGGEGINAIARRAEARLEFRSTDPLRLDRLNRRLRAMAPGFPLAPVLENIGHRPAAAAVQPKFLRLALRQAGEAEGLALQEKPISSNANATLAAGWPSVTFGICRCGNIHRPDEFLERNSLETGWRFLLGILKKLDTLDEEVL